MVLSPTYINTNAAVEVQTIDGNKLETRATASDDGAQVKKSKYYIK